MRLSTYLYHLIKLVVITVIVFTVIGLKGFAQDGSVGYVIVHGVVVGEKRPLNKSIVKLLVKNNTIDKKITSPNGKFQFKLDLDKNYLITFSKDGYVSKKISFVTEVPESESGIWEYKFSVELFEMLEGLDVSILDKPISKIKYYEFSADFDYDDEYTNSMKKQLENLMQQAETLKNDEFQQIIAVADRLYSEKKYEEALNKYDEAIDIDPFSEYPDQKIYEINRYLSKKEAVDEAYNRAIVDGDKNFNIQNYEPALSFYKRALSLKSLEEYPQTKITELESLLNELASESEADKELRENYRKAIKDGDFAIEKEEFDLAKENYNKAIQLISDEQYPKDQLLLIENLIAQKLLKESSKEQLDNEYNEAIKEADEYFNSNNYMEANSAYEKSLAIKPDEKYPKDQIAEISKIFLTQKTIETNYNKHIKDADAYYNSNQFLKAKELYKNALSVKPNENYPKEQIISIDAHFASLKSIDEQFFSLIAHANELFNSQDYLIAKNTYQEASNLKPNEDFPKNQIVEIEKILLAQNNAAEEERLLNEQYSETIARADQLFNTENYSGAKVSYEMAANLKKDESYPKDKIDEINNILEQQLATKNNYENIIASADKKFGSESYEEAKVLYNNALLIYPEKEYPQSKIIEIDLKLKALLTAEELKKSNEREYNRLIAAGDSLFNLKNYNVSKSQFEQALGIKSEEKYPKDKIQEIITLLDKINVLNAEYNRLIASGDSYFTANEFSQAISSYQNALELKPEESYPVGKIEQANLKLAEQERLLADYKKLEDNFANYIATADEAFKNKNYQLAKTNYQNALGLKANEPYPVSKIKEIDNILYEENLVKIEYGKEIEKADTYFNNKEFEFAKAGFEKALTIIENQQYPKDKIEEIDKLIAELKQKQKEYNKAIASADKNFINEDYSDAKTNYNLALSFLPSEEYPKNKITEIDKIIEDNKLAEAEKQRIETGYSNAITAADASFNTQNYAEAKTSYQNALGFKPTETYPGTKLQEIEDILVKARKEKETGYNRAIASADSYLFQKKYDAAKSQYKKALNFLPDEEYPGQKLKEIEDLITLDKADKEKLRLLEEQYTSTIAEANSFFKKMDYVSARASYQKSLNFKPGATFPTKRLSEIEDLIQQQQLASQAETDKEKQKQLDDSKSSFVSDKDFDYSGEERERDFLSKLAKNYPEGKTVENYEKPNKKILRVILNNDGIAKEYIKVKYSYGTFYFRNGQNISQGIFNAETKD